MARAEMHFQALACDYDGTLAREGRVSNPARRALARLRRSGRRLVLVTGRQLDDLARVFPALDLFDRVVAENGGVLGRPASGEERLLGPPADPRLVRALRRAGVRPLSVGRVIVATWDPHEAATRAAIRELGLPLEISLNKGAVMALPAGVDKSSGLAAALGELGLSPERVVGVGDAENDQAFLRLCGCAVAVADAVPALREQVDWVTHGENGRGVTELVERLLEDDLLSGRRRDLPR